MNETNYRTEISHLAGDIIYRVFRYTFEDGVRRREYAEGIFRTLEEAIEKVNSLNG